MALDGDPNNAQAPQVEPVQPQPSSSNRTTVHTQGGDYAGCDLDKRQGETFVRGDVHGDVVREQHIYNHPITTPLDGQHQRNRSQILHKVEDFWVRDVLDQSLYKVARIELGLEAAPDEVV